MTAFEPTPSGVWRAGLDSHVVQLTGRMTSLERAVSELRTELAELNRIVAGRIGRAVFIAIAIGEGLAVALRHYVGG